MKNLIRKTVAFIIVCLFAFTTETVPHVADNGNGTFTNPESRAITADHPGPKPDRKDGSCLVWAVVTE